tara:strand:- start:110 stop:361 length:252 start_codon:yes stop_codon:yes gene_type:complete
MDPMSSWWGIATSLFIEHKALCQVPIRYILGLAKTCVNKGLVFSTAPFGLIELGPEYHEDKPSTWGWLRMERHNRSGVYGASM